ncbi:Metal transporter Nramp5 [Morus notabilis]|uniref:Metal transporter Nramp5 n=1 Tax=Morus notabilis TaxID=981085 RepID=W9SBV7_9ROSA|nr:Metal transporter Nramp5 [Morus notabilis]
MAACFFGEMSYVKPLASGVFKGMFIPELNDQGATRDAIAFLRCLPFVRDREWICILFVAFMINVAVISVSGTVCSANNLSSDDTDRCSDLTLNSASFLLQGFLDLKMKKWMRNLMTRTIAISPSLIASIIRDSSGVGRLINIVLMILSFELPFALIPLLKFSSSTIKIGPYKNSIYASRFRFVYHCLRGCFPLGKTLPYRCIFTSHSFGRSLSPVHLRRKSARSVSYYALFQGWLLLEKSPDCLCTRTSFITEQSFRGLSWFWHESRSNEKELPASGNPSGLTMSSQLLHLNAFRGEPASSGFEWHFTPNHNSSADSSTSVGSDLHLVSPKLHPGHG